ncbi:MAG: glycerol-3-phosphate dehydrogenase/oxidase [Candidatus Limnocylindrales bacterium]
MSAQTNLYSSASSMPVGVAGLDSGRFDAVVIGGGILGAGVARELARRGLATLLVERRDFAWGTTARSTRLIHGGLRYLANYDLGVVREGLRERAWQLRRMPNLVTPLPFILPFYHEPLWHRLRLRAGLTLYDLLSPRRSMPRHRFLSRSAAAAIEPGLSTEGLSEAALYWDAQVELPERLVLDALRAAEDAGAGVRNHVAATGLRRDASGRVVGVELEATLDGRSAVVSSGRVINATGPWADVTLAGLGLDAAPLLRLVQGIHVVYDRLADHAVAFEHPDDRRLCFAVPWQGMTMIGTTERDVLGGPDEARVTRDEVAYLIRAANRVLPASSGTGPLWGSVGVRSLIRESGIANRVSRRHLLVDHARDGAPGLTTVAGGKLTAWRSIAAEVVDELLDRRDRSALGDVDVGHLTLPPEPSAAAGPYAHRLWRLYGARATEVSAIADADTWWSLPLLPVGDAIRAEVAHALAVEWAQTLGDVVLRRMMLGFGPDLGRAAAEAVGAVALERLGWDTERVARELAAFDIENLERRLEPA